METKGKEYVVLLHGLNMRSFIMQRLRNYLSAAGYSTVNRSYPSTKYPIEKLAERYIRPIVEGCKDATKIHFVTHSLGGIVVRQYLQNHELPTGSRVVMLCPPNSGSEVSDFYKNIFLYKWMFGPAGQQLTTKPDSLPNTLKPVSAEIGIIAGNRSYEPWYSPLFDGPHDGKVAVERTKLPEMKDFIVVNHTHTFTPVRSDVFPVVLNFLRDGSFRTSE